MSVKEIRRFKQWAQGRYLGTLVQVDKADYAKIMVPDDGLTRAFGYFGGRGEPRYLGLKSAIRNHLKSVLHRYDDAFGHSYVKFTFFHESDALQFRLQFL